MVNENNAIAEYKAEELLETIRIGKEVVENIRQDISNDNVYSIEETRDFIDELAQTIRRSERLIDMFAA